MKTASRHPNLITRQAINARFQAPAGAIQRPPRTWRMGTRRPPSEPGRVHEGIGLVRWLLDNGFRDEAKIVFAEIKSGKRQA